MSSNSVNIKIGFGLSIGHPGSVLGKRHLGRLFFFRSPILIYSISNMGSDQCKEEILRPPGEANGSPCCPVPLDVSTTYSRSIFEKLLSDGGVKCISAHSVVWYDAGGLSFNHYYQNHKHVGLEQVAVLEHLHVS